MQKTTIKTKLYTEKTQEIIAYVSDSFKGLAVHRSSHKKDLWTISHEASGMNLCDGHTFQNRAVAVDLAVQFAALNDWTKSASEVVNSISKEDRKRMLHLIYQAM